MYGTSSLDINKLGNACGVSAGIATGGCDDSSIAHRFSLRRFAAAVRKQRIIAGQQRRAHSQDGTPTVCVCIGSPRMRCCKMSQRACSATHQRANRVRATNTRPHRTHSRSNGSKPALCVIQTNKTQFPPPIVAYNLRQSQIIRSTLLQPPSRGPCGHLVTMNSPTSNMDASTERDRCVEEQGRAVLPASAPQNALLLCLLPANHAKQNIKYAYLSPQGWRAARCHREGAPGCGVGAVAAGAGGCANVKQHQPRKLGSNRRNTSRVAWAGA